MRAKLSDKVERGRITTGHYKSPRGAPYGAFEVLGPSGVLLRIIATDGKGEDEVWEHVSVTLARPRRCPSWAEMSAVKEWFWEDEECVAQFHVPKSQHINNHPYCLHLWHNPAQPFALPPPALVGVQSAGVLS